MTQALAISGTPGSGKTAVGALLAERLDVEVLELSQLVEREKMYSNQDVARATLIANVEILEKYLATLLSQAKRIHLVLGHYADIVPDAFLKSLVVLRCHPKILTERLRERQWSTTKILENIQAEILGECTSQALLRHPPEKIFEVDVSHKSKEAAADCIEMIFSGKGTEYKLGRISWLKTLDAQVLHRIMEEGELP